MEAFFQSRCRSKATVKRDEQVTEQQYTFLYLKLVVNTIKRQTMSGLFSLTNLFQPSFECGLSMQVDDRYQPSKRGHQVSFATTRKPTRARLISLPLLRTYYVLHLKPVKISKLNCSEIVRNTFLSNHSQKRFLSPFFCVEVNV